MMTTNEAAPSTVTPTSSGSKQFSVRLARTPEDLAKATALRYNVFCVEQGYPLLIERDGKDDVSDQLLLIDQETEEVAGVARWIATTCKLGRVAVSKAYRGTGGGEFSRIRKTCCRVEWPYLSGRILVLGLEDHLKSREGRAGVENRDKSECTINVSSQLPAISFYTRLGYEIEGQPYEEAGTPHVYCKKVVRLPRI
ncbi:BQ5605_C002g01457 [Microbotryum silenes-dioicae]|uniref:BQ5605_C002g01457 protein n=1 Tax=Microbotryum silenes-dioicae TaxID=796604 RepID=A0A2X0MTK2_9BASI|nr:BQ5605_C002g01457 [Microbotryum silenes-dioicae]